MLVVITNIPTPYRTAFFNAVAEESSRRAIGFKVLYCAKTEPGRHWPYEPEKMLHAHEILRGFHPSLTGIHAHLNPGVLAEIHRFKPDTLLVAGSWNTPTMLLAGLNVLSLPCRRIFWSEGHADAALHQAGPIAWLRRRVYRRYDGFAVPNARSGEWALAQAGEPKPIIHLPNAINVAPFIRPSAGAKAAARQRFGLPLTGRVLVQVSALTARKGVLPLARAFLALPPEVRSGATLLFVGDGDQRPELVVAAAASGGAIRVLGQLAPDEVREALWAADAFILNTLQDPNPLAPIEAAAAGLPIVLSRKAGNVTELVERPGTGFTLDDPADPAEALRKVLTVPAEQLVEMGRRAAELARTQFAAPAIARSLLRQLYP